MKSFLSSYRVIVCAGNGGVGKTTVASALGMLSAREGKKVLLFTIDPSRRLATCLGLDGWNGDVVSVERFESGGELFASMVDHKKIFDNFIIEHGPSLEISERMLQNRLYKELSTNLSGSQEFTSLQALLNASSSGRYDLIILDTPPAQHTLDFVKAPQVLFNIFSGSVVDWFKKLTDSKSKIQSLFNKGTQAAVAVLEKITGAEFISELQEFFKHVSFWSQAIQDRVIETQKILSEKTTGFLIVTNLDDSRIYETVENIKEFKRLGFAARCVVVNKVMPQFLDIEGASAEAQKFYQQWISSEKNQMSILQSQLQQDVELFTLPQSSFQKNELEVLKQLSKLFLNQGFDKKGKK